MKKNNSLKSSGIQQHLQLTKHKGEKSSKGNRIQSSALIHVREVDVISFHLMKLRWEPREQNIAEDERERERESVRRFCWLDSRVIWNGTHFQRAPTIQYFHARDLHLLVKRILPSSRFADSTTFIIAEACLAKRWGVTSIAPLISDSKGSS